MKYCPRCKMSLDSHCECPVCRNDLTNEPYTDYEGEIYAFNKYLIPYLLRVHYFPIICILAVIIRILFTLNTVNWYCLLPIAFVILSLLESLFKSRIANLMSWMYSEDYMNITSTIAKYFLGGAGVICSFLLW